MPFFITGFLFTGGPKWLKLPSVSARSLLRPLIMMLVGWAFAIAGFHLNARLAAVGILLVSMGWTWICLKFTSMVRQSQMRDRVHPILVALACNVGAVTLWLATLALAIKSDLLLRTATQAGIWWFIAPVFAVVSHRMIPFFSASAVPILDAWRPLWLMMALLASLWLEGLAAIADIWWWPISAEFRWLQVVFEVPAGLLMIWLAVRWGLIQSLKIRLLAMLHGGFVWLGLSFMLNAVSHTLMAVSTNGLSLGLAPLHALTMGYLGATMFAMTTRVSSGHGGRPVTADNPAWVLYWILQTAVALRVVAALWPAMGTLLTLLAIFAWSVATIGWSIRYGRWFGRPRADGRPG